MTAFKRLRNRSQTVPLTEGLTTIFIVSNLLHHCMAYKGSMKIILYKVREEKSMLARLITASVDNF